MRKEPYTNKELFEIIIKKVAEKNEKSKILDYYLGEGEIKLIKDYQFDCCFKLDYGCNEGIYLDCYIIGIVDETNEYIRVSLGTLKTLDTSDIAMHDMADLEADFIIEMKKFVDSNLNDFTWQGYGLKIYDENDKYIFGYDINNIEKVTSKKEELEKTGKYNKIVIFDYSSRKYI